MQALLTNSLQDIRFALRQLRRSPGFAVTAVLTLALGIGATTAIFSLIYQVMLRSLPVQRPEQLYKVGKANDCCVTGGVQDEWNLFSYAMYRDLRDHTPAVEGMAAVSAGTTMFSVRQEKNAAAAQPQNVRFVSGNYFSLLGVGAYAGRLLSPDDDSKGAVPVVVISYTLWQTKFAGDPTLLGSTLLLTGRPVTVVGITAQHFRGERNETASAGMWLALNQEPVFENNRRLLDFPERCWLDLLVRVKDRGRVSQVRAAIQGELQRWIGENRQVVSSVGVTDQQLARQTTELVPASGGINTLADSYADSLKLLQLVAGFVLLIACANLANLMLVRGMARRQQLSILSALGAPRLRQIRQMLVEALLLALIGGAAALGIAYAGTRAMIALALGPADSNPLHASPSLPVLAFALALSLLTGILFGAAPAWIASRANPADALRGVNRSTRDTSALPQRLLVIFQTALSLVLLSTAGLLITSLRRLEHQDFRFEPEHRLLVFTDLAAAGYRAAQLESLYRRFDEEFARLSGMRHFAYATYGPMTDDNWGTNIWRPGDDSQASQNAKYTLVSSNFFTALGTHVLIGRAISERDTSTSSHVAVVNQLFVDRYLKGRQPLGERFGPDPSHANEYEVVGIVDNTKYGDPGDPILPMFFTPLSQTTTYTLPGDIKEEEEKHFATNLIVDYQGDEAIMAAAIRHTLSTINPDIPVLRILSYQDQLASQFTKEDLVVRLTTLFGTLALVLAALGLYGVTAYNVQRRTGEIGIRMALGASRFSVVVMIVRGAVAQAASGLALGVPLSLAAGRLLRGILYNTPEFQPVVLAAVIALLLFATLIAAALPARRAASTDPIQALRME